MKRALRTLTITIAAVAISPTFATDYVVDLIEPSFQQTIVNQLQQGRQLVDVEMEPVLGGADLRYSGVFAPISGLTHNILRVDAPTWDAWVQSMGALDGRWLDFEVEVLNGVEVRSGVFWEGGGEDYSYALFSDSSEAEFQADLENYQDQGLALIDFESFVNPLGETRYGGLWVDGELQPRTNVLYGLTWTEVGDLLDPLVGRVVDLERYIDAQGRLRWGIVLAAYPDGESFAIQPLDATALANLDAGRSDNLIDVDSYEIAPGLLFYTAVWGDDWKSFREVDPLPLSTPVAPSTDVQEIITAFEANGAGEMGLFGRNVRLGRSVEYRADEPFYLASSAKLAIHLRLWQLHQQNHLNVDTDVLRYSDDPDTATPWFVDERPDCLSGTECGLSTGACGDDDDRNIDTSLLTLDRGMMNVSDNAATSILVDDPTKGLAFDDLDLNEWVSSLSGVGRGFGVLTSIQDLDRIISWQGQFPNSLDQPSYFGAPRAGLETVRRNGGLGYQECNIDSPDEGEDPWTGTPCGCGGATGCNTGETCLRRQDPWGDLTAYLLSIDPTWTAGNFPAGFGGGFARYYNTGLNWATPRAFGELQEQFVAGELLDAATNERALDEMIGGNSPLVPGVPVHIERFSKGGSKGGSSTPCSDTTIFRVGPDAVVVNVMTKNNWVNPNPAFRRSCGQIRSFWGGPPTTSGTALGRSVVQQLLADLRTATPQVVGFAPTTIHPGQTFEAVVDVTNSGGVETSAFDVTFYAVLDSAVGDGNDLPIGSAQVPVLAAGETLRVQFSGAFPANIPPGAYELGWYIDPPNTLPPPNDAPFGKVGEFLEGNEQYGVIQDSVLTVLPPAPPCIDVDLDGYVECTADCDPTGMVCGDCNDTDPFVNPIAADLCNQLDDDCNGTPDPGALRPATLRFVVDPDPRSSDDLGIAVAALGDLDGDGVDEYAVGQPSATTPIASTAGAVRVHSGASGTLYCEAYDPDGGGYDGFGEAIAGVSDVTGDGVPDFVVGAPAYDGAAGNTGTALLFDGATCLIHDRFVPVLAEASELFGTTVAGVGDVDLDGVKDIAVGAPYRDGAGSNRGAIVIHSGATGDVIRTLTDPNGFNNDRIGTAIAAVEDLDGDLVPDIVAGVHNRNGARGAVLVFSGSSGAVVATWTRAGVAGGDSFGFSVAALSDVTGDGVADLVVGTINSETLAGTNVGDAQILSGADGTVVHTLADLSGGPSDDFGYAVAGAGDIDDDGIEDVVVGAPLHDGSAGTDAGGVVVFSGATGVPLLDLEDPGSHAGDRLGWSVARLGDLTGDGLPEFAAGAPRADEIEAFDAGRVVVWSLEADCDADGATPFDGDCDDQDATARPGAAELCDTIDNDCDAAIDEDDDGDSFAVCDECDDTDAEIYPGAAERCNGVDDDCDLDIDEGADVDLDGYTDTCDCNDGNNSVNPGIADATCDRVDQDCNGVTDDGFAAPVGERTLVRTPGGAGDELGATLAIVGDLNGDGLVEIAAGVPLDDTVALGAGAVAVYDGATGNLHCLLTDPDGVGFDELGRSIAALGDVTGDGVPDVAAGAPRDDDPLASAGTVIVFSGADCTVAYKAFDPLGFASARLGEVVAAIGDLNGDGFSDFAAAAPDSDDFGITNTGRVVAFDGATGAVLYRVTNVNPASGEQFGTSIAGGRDLDADGVPDFVVGTFADDSWVGTNSGTVLVVSGATGIPIRKLVDDDGGLSDHLGTSVALIDDLDGDAVADILAGAPGDDEGGTNAGAVVVFSGADGTRIGRATFDEPGTLEELGTSVAAMPDVDGDGIADIASGAAKDDDGDTDTGSVYLISGADLSLIRRVYRPIGQFRAGLGASVAIAPDLTGDGMPEIVAGAPLYDGAAGTSTGLVVVFALEADCDGDGVSPFGGDCDDGNGSASGRPGDVQGLVFEDHDNVSWQPPSDPGGTIGGLAYDLLESGDAADFSAGAICVESEYAGTTALIPGVPASGSVSFYLVRASNACAVGPAGYDSGLTERAAGACP